MLYHTAICVHDVERAARFYDAVFSVLGCGRIWDLLPDAVAYGETRGEFWIQSPSHQNSPDVSRGAHYAFAARDKDTLRAFYAAALAAGATGESAPAAHPEYSPDYYGAIFIDPDGNKVEVVVYPRSR